jgi:hypothetical protein
MFFYGENLLKLRQNKKEEKIKFTENFLSWCSPITPLHLGYYGVRAWKTIFTLANCFYIRETV